MNHKFRIWLSPPFVTEKENIALRTCVESGWLAPTGPELQEFEDKLKEYYGVKHVLCTQSGTAALHLALLGCGVVNTQDIILCPSYTYIATVNPITYVGAIPVFVGTANDSYHLALEHLVEAYDYCCQNIKKPKAVIISHLYGRSAELQNILDWRDSFAPDLLIIEDAAEAMGVYTPLEQGNCLAGKIGKIGVVSFNGNKIITTTQGGALITNDEVIYQKALHLAKQSTTRNDFFIHDSIGYNYRLSNLLASFGIAQMTNLRERIEKRRYNYYKYQQELLKHPLFFYFIPELENSYSTHWLTVVHLMPAYTNKRDSIIKALYEKGIEARTTWKPLHTLRPYQNNLYFGDSTLVDLYNSGICLPSGFMLSDTEIEEILSIIIATVSK